MKSEFDSSRTGHQHSDSQLDKDK
eukprot:COSAG03_NODE_21009_length_310_cov_0.943128_1_plen_23_part_10